MSKHVGLSKGWKVLIIIIAVIVLIGTLIGIWLGLVYAKEIVDDTKKALDEIKQEQVQPPNEETGNENTSAKIGLSLSLVDNVWTAKLL